MTENEPFMIFDNNGEHITVIFKRDGDDGFRIRLNREVAIKMAALLLLQHVQEISEVQNG